MFKYGYMGIDGMNQHCNAREMERTEARDPSQVRERDLVRKMCRNVIENAAEPHMIERMRGRRGERAGSAVAVFVNKPGGER